MALANIGLNKWLVGAAFGSAILLNPIQASAACKSKDLAGSWQVSMLLFINQIPGWETRKIKMNKKGKIASSGNCEDSSNVKRPVMGDSLKVKKNCQVKGTILNGDNERNLTKGSLGQNGAFISGVGDADGIYPGFFFLTKQ